MHASQPRENGRLRHMLVIGILVSLLISACGVPERAAQPTLLPAAQLATATRPTIATRATLVAQQPTALPTQTGSAQQGQTAPTPACTFNAPAGPEPQVPALDAYTFSEPRVVLTGQAIGIADWLPDSQRVLITHRVGEKDQGTIETFDTRTGVIERYADLEGANFKPIWLPTEQAVVFSDFVDNSTRAALRVARGKGAPAEDIVADLGPAGFVVSPDGQVLFSAKTDPGQPHILALSNGLRQERPLSAPTQSQLRRFSSQPQASGLATNGEPFNATWHPDGNQIVFFNTTSFYLTNLTTGSICTLSLGTEAEGKLWARSAHWSADGRFLAIRVATGDSLPANSIDLRVLDITTGKLQRIDVPVPYISEIVWAANSRHMLALGQVGIGEGGDSLLGLFIVDVYTGIFRRILPDRTFSSGLFGGGEGGGLAWSPDAQEVLVKCPTRAEKTARILEDRVCLLDIRVQS